MAIPVAGCLFARRALVPALLVIAAVKCAILIANGPSIEPDSWLYLDYADAILDHGRAFAPVRWGTEALPPFIFRPPGYPLVLALAKLIAPAGFATLTVVLQCLVNAVIICLLFVVAARLLRSTAAALIVVLLYAFSTSILWDNSVLSDSLYASLWNLVIIALLGCLIGCWRLSPARGFGLGLLWGVSLWVRDVGLYFTLLPLVLMAIIAVRERRYSWRSAVDSLAFLLPASAIVAAYIGLNAYRTGEVFYSLTGTANWLRPVFDMAQYGYAQPFTEDDLVAMTVRETMRDYWFDSQLRLIDALHERCHCAPTQLQSIVFAKFAASVREHPLAYARVVAANFNPIALGELLTNPIATINQFFQLGTPLAKRLIPGPSIRNFAALQQHFSLTALALMALSAITKLVSALLFFAYLIVTPWLLLRAFYHRRPLTVELAGAAALWFSFVGVSLAFSLIHYEGRHVLPLLPTGILGVVYTVCRVSRGLREAVGETAVV